MAGAQSRRAKLERDPAPPSVGTSSQSASASPSGHASRSPTVGTEFDGNRDQQPLAPLGDGALSKAQKNLDMGTALFNVVRGQNVDLAARPPTPSKLGREIIMGLNTFAVTIPTIKVYQYQVMVGSGAEKRGLIMKVWESKAVQSALPIKETWIFDGNALAWSVNRIPWAKDDDRKELRIQVDLDAEEQKNPRAGKPNIHRIVIKETSDIDFASLTAYLAKKADFNNKCLEAVTFMDHLLREAPRKNFTQIKRSFFAKGQKRFDLGSGVEAFKGVYQSLRIAHAPGGVGRLTCNVDVSNGTFFTGGDMKTVVVRVLGLRSEAEIDHIIRPSSENLFKKLAETRRFRRLHVFTMHRGKGKRDEYIIDKFLENSAAKHMIDLKNPDGTKTWVSVQQYFQQRHGIRLSNPGWPVVQMTKKAVLPLELLRLEENQRYAFKLDERQTAAMIKVAVTAPKERWEDIEHGLGMVNWREDPYLRAYGMNIDRNRTFVKGRLLQNPKLVFGGAGAAATTDPKLAGRWDLKGKKFLVPNQSPLKSWGICVVTGRFQTSKADVDRFVAEFIRVYKIHGGKVENTPHMQMGSNSDPGKRVEELWNATGNKFQMRPQILLFILPDKDSVVYGRIKRSCECRYGVVSQCMQSAHISKCQPQYISNVLMKFNAKLGGITNRAVGPTSSGQNGVFKHNTCIIGADVSHAAPGSLNASMAALTVSTDKLATRYAAGCEVNGFRVEMITPENFNKLLKPLLQNWVQTVGQGKFPAHIIYFRDGVSEGQFAQVLEQEITAIKKILSSVSPSYPTKFIVIVASKRHHVRFFPKAGESGTSDRNGNPLPGTLVETGVTHPFENDFYLCSHAAIKGTARPVHYNVLLNEPGLSNEELQTMIYEHCYQYIRATTPVSLFPAVYYAHLASNRAAHHDKNFGGANSAEKAAQQKAQTNKSHSDATTAPPIFPPLMSMQDQAAISKSMWYI